MKHFFYCSKKCFLLYPGQNLNTTANPLTATTIAQLSCNFESQSICNYHQSTTGLQWKWQHGGTPSANTGPSSDHTTGTATGKSPPDHAVKLFH